MPYSGRKNLIPETFYIRFKYQASNDRLAKLAKTKKWHETLIASKDAFHHQVGQMNETCEQIKQHLVDTNSVVKKGMSGMFKNSFD